jgi:hypothetical protein
MPLPNGWNKLSREYQGLTHENCEPGILVWVKDVPHDRKFNRAYTDDWKLGEVIGQPHYNEFNQLSLFVRLIDDDNVRAYLVSDLRKA